MQNPVCYRKEWDFKLSSFELQQ